MVVGGTRFHPAAVEPDFKALRKPYGSRRERRLEKLRAERVASLDDG